MEKRAPGPPNTPAWVEWVSSWLRQHTLAVDIVIAAILGWLSASVWIWASVGLELQWSSPLAAQPPWSTLVILAAAAAHTAFAFRRIRPSGSFAVISVAIGFQFLITPYFLLPSMLLFLGALYAYCAWGPQSSPTVGFVVGIGGTIVTGLAGLAISGWAGGVASWAAGEATMLSYIFLQALPVVLSAWSLGMFRRVRLAYVIALQQRAAQAEAEREERARRAVADERARIAREMHDLVAHALSVVISQANGGRYLARSDPEGAATVLTTISETGSQALTDMRGLLGVLRDGDNPAVEGDASAARSPGSAAEGHDSAAEGHPQPTLSELPSLLDRVAKARLPVDYFESGDRCQLSPSAELAAFRLVQEALTNTMKHGGPNPRVRLSFEWFAEELVITVEDDGTGGGESGGLGLIGMRERLAIVGGTVSAGKLEPVGFRVSARIPYRAENTSA